MSFPLRMATFWPCITLGSISLSWKPLGGRLNLYSFSCLFIIPYFVIFTLHCFYFANVLPFSFLSITKAQVCSQASSNDRQRLLWSAEIISISLWWEKVNKWISSNFALPEIAVCFMMLQQKWKVSHRPGVSRPLTPFCCCLGLGKKLVPSVVSSSQAIQLSFSVKTFTPLLFELDWSLKSNIF